MLTFTSTDGMILFPSTPPFTNLGPMGVSMFFVSAVIAQFVYSSGGSGFAGGNGSMMIEVVVCSFLGVFPPPQERQLMLLSSQSFIALLSYSRSGHRFSNRRG